MRLRAAILLLTAATLPGPSFAKDKPPISLAKVGKWELNYDTDSCHLIGTFGTDEQQVVLSLTRYQPGDQFELMLVGKPVSTTEPKLSIEIQFGTDAATQKHIATSGTVADGRKMVTFFVGRFDGNYPRRPAPQLSPISPKNEADVTFVTFKLESSKRYSLQTGSLGVPMAEMRECTDNLVKSWGYDPETQAALKNRATPIGTPARWISADDYPLGALHGSHNGLIEFRLDIDENGAINGCHILHKTNPDDFADLTCQLISKRAKFEPALDAQRHTVKSYFIGTVVWNARPG